MDHWIIIVFLFLTLIVGMISGLKINTVKDYTIGEKNAFSPSVITMTVLATMIGGFATTGIAAEFFKYGYIYFVPLIGIILGFILLAIFVAPKFDNRFHGMQSSADIIGAFYGKEAERFTGLIGTIFGIGTVSVQVMALASLCANFIGIDYRLSVVISGGIMVIYSAFGGIRSVAITDVMQFFVLASGVPIIANLCFQKIGGIEEIISGLPESHTSIFTHDNFNNYLMSFLAYIMPFTWLYPALVQRYLMVREGKQAAKITYLYTFLLTALIFMMACIAFSSVQLFPQTEPNAIIPNIIAKILPTGLKGIALIGLIAVIMSTADSFLNSAGILLTLNTFFPEKIREINKIRLLRLNTLFIGIIAIFIALQKISIFHIMVIVLATMSFSSIPLFMKIIGLNVSKKQFWANVFCGLGAFIIVKLYFDPDIKICTFTSTSVSLIAFITTHLIQNKGCFSYDSGRKQNNIVKNLTTVIDYLPTLQKLVNYSAKKVKDTPTPYRLFGVFCCVNYIVPYFMWSFDQFLHQEYVIFIRFVAGFLCLGLIMADRWYSGIKKYLPLYWHFTVMFCLPFITTIMFFSTKAEHGWLLNMALSILFLAIIVDWQTFIILNIIGFTAGVIFYNTFIASIVIDLDMKTIYLIVYTFIFSTFIGILFARNREICGYQKLKIMRFFGTSMAHEIKVSVGQMATVLETLNNCWKHSKFKKSKTLVKIEMPRAFFDVFDAGLSGYKRYIRESNEIINNLLICVQDSIKKDSFENFSIDDVITEVINDLLLSKDLQSRITYNKINDIKVFAPKVLVKHVIINLIKNACKYALIKRGSVLEIKVEKSRVYFHDTGYGISPIHIGKIFDQFYSTDKIGTGLGLAFCKMVMEGIDGRIECVSEERKSTTFILTFSQDTAIVSQNENSKEKI